MTTVAARESIMIGDARYLLHEHLENPTHDLIAEYSGHLVVAQQVDADGFPTMMPEPSPFLIASPETADEFLRNFRKSRKHMNTMMNVPPAAGVLSLFNDGYFAIKQPNSVTALIPYDSDTFRYLTRLASIACD